MANENSKRVLEDSLRDAGVIWKSEYPYFVHPLSDGIPRMEPQVLRAVRDLIVDSVQWDRVDLMVGPEAMALPLLAVLGEAVNKPWVVIRKRPYGLASETEAQASTGYSESALYINDVMPGERLLVIDDVISTGGTLESLLTALTERGSVLEDVVAVIEKGDGRERLHRRYPEWPLRSLVRIEIIDGRVQVCS